MLGTVILAGGKGNRIGGNKPFMKLWGKSLIFYVLEAASRVADDVIVVVGKEEESRFESLTHRNVKVVGDIISGGGPLIGVYSGLKHLTSEYTIVLPCDSPFIQVEMLRYLISIAGRADAVIPQWPNGYIEPLHSVYNVSATLKASQAAIEEEDFKISNMIERLEKIIYVPVERLKKFDQDLLAFLNINNMEDLTNAEAFKHHT